MSIKPIVFLFISAASLALCGAVNAPSFTSKGVDLKAYKSYAWISPTDTSFFFYLHINYKKAKS